MAIKKVGRFFKRIVKPQTAVGKVVGVVGSVLGIGGGGVLAGFDAGFVALVVIAMAGGYAFGWSKEQVKDFISFLNSEQGKNSK